jgi:hypothetical protein
MVSSFVESISGAFHEFAQLLSFIKHDVVMHPLGPERSSPIL